MAKRALPTILILAVILSGGFFYFYSPAQIFIKNLGGQEVSAQTGTVTITVRVNLCVNNNEVLEGDEQCDGSNLDNQTCQSLGYDSGALSCDTNCSFDTSGCTTAPPATTPGPGGGGYTPPSSILILRGRAYPEAVLTILKDGQLFVAGKGVDAAANFEERIFGISAGTYTFSFRAKDRQSRESAVSSVTVTVPEAVTVLVEGILLAPTIELKETILRGEAAPASEITLYFAADGAEIVKKVMADIEGKWFFSLRGAGLKEKTNYSVRVKAVTSDGLASNFSKILKLYFEEALPEVPEIPEEEPEERPEEEPEAVIVPADLNGDDKVNIVDFSILLYWWGKYSERVDFNNDGAVNLVDFSIMMYHWTG